MESKQMESSLRVGRSAIAEASRGIAKVSLKRIHKENSDDSLSLANGDRRVTFGQTIAS